MLPQGVGIMIAAVGGLLLFFFLVMSLSNRYNLNNIKDKTVGHGQHGTARWATKKEIKKSISTSTMSRINGVRILIADQRNKELWLVVKTASALSLRIFCEDFGIDSENCGTNSAARRTRNIFPNQFRKALPQQWLTPEMCMLL